MRIVQVKNNEIIGSPFKRPQRWRNTTIGGASPPTLRSLGLYPVETYDPGPSHDYRDRSGTSLSLDTTKGVVVETVQYADMPLDERKKRLSEKARQEYNRTLETGFTDSDGTQWSATEEAARKTARLTQRISAGKGLPNNKSKLTLRDANGVPHDLTPIEIETLSIKGSDFIDKAEDRLGELLTSIEAAQNHDDLNAIDPTSGWPS